MSHGGSDDALAAVIPPVPPIPAAPHLHRFLPALDCNAIACIYLAGTEHMHPSKLFRISQEKERKRLRARACLGQL